MDRKTRFLLASKVSEARDINGAIAVFKEAIKNAHDKLPEQVLTDAFTTYRQGKHFQIVLGHRIAYCDLNRFQDKLLMTKVNLDYAAPLSLIRSLKMDLRNRALM